jgi:hypothetical protein
VEGFGVLEALGVEDAIVKATVVEGSENLVIHG